MSEEAWKPIPDRERMEASSLGRIRIDGVVVDQKLYAGQYFKVRSTGERSTELTHRLVAAAFHGAQWHLCVNHKDLNKRNNAPDNLEWVTQKENVKHANAMGVTNAGVRNGMCKSLPSDVVKACDLVREGMDRQQAAELCGVTYATVCKALRGEKWKSLGMFPLKAKNARRMTKEQKILVVDLAERGESIQQIVDKTGAPKTTVWRIVRSLEKCGA